MTDVQDVAAYLSSKGVQVHRASGSEVTAHCIYCADGDPKGKGKLYLNTESWLYDCKRCGASGNRKTLLEFYGDEDSLEFVAGTDPMLRRRILTETAQLAHEMLMANDAMLLYLLGRGLSLETIVRKMYGYVPRNVGISAMIPVRQSNSAKVADLLNAGIITAGGQEFFNHSIVIPYWSHGTVVQLREKKVDGKYRTAGGDVARLYNADTLNGADQVVVVEGEFDCDMLEQELRSSSVPALMSTAVVALPGAMAWPDGFVESMLGIRRVFIGLDPDETGNKAAAKLKDELGSRSRRLALTEDLPKCDWNDFLKDHDEVKNPHGGHTWRDVQQMMLTAELAGKRMYSVADAEAKWNQQRVEKPGIQFGWPQLDAILRPGLKPGQLFIPLAKTGTGKSVFLSNVAHNLRARRMLVVSLEMTASEIFEHMRRIHHFWFPTATAAERNEDYKFLRIVDQNRLKPGDLRQLTEEYAEDVGAPPEVLTVDYLQYFARGFRGAGMYEKSSDAVMELKASAKEEALALICPSQVSRSGEDGKPLSLDDARDSGVIEETGDFVVSLYRPDQVVMKDDPTTTPVQTGSLNLQILKSRHGGKGRVFNYRLSNLSLAIADVIERKACQRIDQENTLYRNGTHYDDYRKTVNVSVAQMVLPAPPEQEALIP